MIEIYYFVDNERHALRVRSAVPNIGDYVKLKTGVYKVTRVLWIEDSDVMMANGATDFHVRVDVEKIAE